MTTNSAQPRDCAWNGVNSHRLLEGCHGEALLIEEVVSRYRARGAIYAQIMAHSANHLIVK